MPERQAAVLIDNGYLVKILEQEYKGQRIDYLDFSERLCEANALNRKVTCVYDGAPYQDPSFNARERKNYGNRMRFFANLRKLEDFEVRLGRQVPYYDEAARKVRFKQKGVDVMIAVDMVVRALDPVKRVDAVILVAGDGDFVPAVEYIRSVGVEVILYHSNGRNPDGRKKYADGLRSACSRSHPMSAALWGARSLPADEGAEALSSG